MTAAIVVRAMPATGLFPVPPPGNRGRRYPPDPLTRDEVTALLRACQRRYPTGLRNRALIVLMWRTGLRVREAVSLHLRDLDRSQGLVRVREGKGQRPRTVPMDDTAWEVVAKWIDRRRSMGVGDGPVFCTLQGGRLSTNYVRDAVHRLARKARLDRRVHPHAFRHTFARELEAEGLRVTEVQRLLGHRNLATTWNYLRGIGVPPELVQAVRSRPAW